MNAALAITNDISLVFREPGAMAAKYPTSCIQKGLILCCNGLDLVEEGAGFGLPLARFGHQTVFPGSARATVAENRHGTLVTIEYHLNLAEVVTMAAVGKITSPPFYRTREFFSSLHRRRPGLRAAVDSASRVLKRISGMKTTFEPGAHGGTAKFTYRFSGGGSRLHIIADFRGLETRGLTEIIIANEQGGRNFHSYRDSTGLTLSGDSIGTWDRVDAGRASLLNSKDKIAFSLPDIARARMFRGRELAPGRLDWAGLNYVTGPQTSHLEYDIRLESMP